MQITNEVRNYKVVYKDPSTQAVDHTLITKAEAGKLKDQWQNDQFVTIPGRGTMKKNTILSIERYRGNARVESFDGAVSGYGFREVDGRMTYGRYTQKPYEQDGRLKYKPLGFKPMTKEEELRELKSCLLKNYEDQIEGLVDGGIRRKEKQIAALEKEIAQGAENEAALTF